MGAGGETWRDIARSLCRKKLANFCPSCFEVGDSAQRWHDMTPTVSVSKFTSKDCSEHGASSDEFFISAAINVFTVSSRLSNPSEFSSFKFSPTK